MQDNIILRFCTSGAAAVFVQGNIVAADSDIFIAA
jgi:hypothetical protein